MLWLSLINNVAAPFPDSKSAAVCVPPFLVFQLFSSQKGPKYQDSQLRFLLSLSPVNKPAPANSNSSLATIVSSEPWQWGGSGDVGTDVCKQGTPERQQQSAHPSLFYHCLSCWWLDAELTWHRRRFSSPGCRLNANKIFGRRIVSSQGLFFTVCCQTFNPVFPNFFWVTTRLMFEKSHRAPPNKYVQRIFTNGDRNCLALLDST